MTAADWLLLVVVAVTCVGLVWVGVHELRAHDRRRRAHELEEAIRFAESLGRHPARRSTPPEDRADWPPRG